MSEREPARHQSATPEPSRLPTPYYLDESDPDVLVPRREDHASVAAFSAMGVTRDGIFEAAREDYAALLERQRTHERAREGDGEPADTRTGGEPLVPPASANRREDAQAKPRSAS